MAGTVFLVDAVSGAPEYSGEMVRQALSALCGVAPSSRPLGARSGVRPGTPTSIVTATSTLWTVTPFSGVLDVQTSATAGPYLFAFDENQTGAVTAADATNPRWDLLSVQVSDPAEDSTSTPKVEIVYTAGTAASSPALPATPARAMALAKIVVPKSGGGSPSIVWLAPYFGDPLRAEYQEATGGTSLGTTFKTLGVSTAIVDTIGLSYASGVLTMPAGSDGNYRLSGRMAISGASTACAFAIGILINGSFADRSLANFAGLSGPPTVGSVPREFHLAAGDQLQIQGYCSVSGYTSSGTAGYQPFIRIERIG